MHPIFGFVGSSGSGKSTLILSALAAFPNQLGIVKSLTTRPRRGSEDDLFYDFVSVEEMRRRERDGRLIQISSYAGNLYGNDRNSVNALLEKKFGIMAIVQEGIRNFRAAGYKIITLNIVPIKNTQVFWVDETRKSEDKKRSRDSLVYDAEIRNAFVPGGKEAAMREAEKVFKVYGLMRETSASSDL